MFDRAVIVQTVKQGRPDFGQLTWTQRQIASEWRPLNTVLSQVKI